MTGRTRLAACLAALTLGPLLAACATVTGSVSAGSTAAAPQPSYTLAVRPAVTAVKPKGTPPAVGNTGTAWPAILASLSGYGQWLLANPDLSLVGTITAPGCTMTDLFGGQVQALLDEQARLKPSPPAFGPITAPSPVTGNQVTLTVTASRPAEPVFSRVKNVQVQTYTALPPTSMQITLVRGADQRWRFCTVEAMTDAGAPDDPSLPLF